ncbi:MAG: polysaccharide pyruvyl transferase family protein [Anaerobutyricum hallii]|uniref:polysaccharide pyruvyl transferase family protein n=1 Tax=Anaerobutyricum hallii TaxID=39488 RepID=UPI002A832A92|nr:polysaccharide pyruvyl transferase family protein [Anaerobutyricum hallii]MDY4576879.1 polysaccharide pyruvyl transferase family protein [Anaerobutyricum hallii]
MMIMVKVGILSMQRIANYGSFLQAYGLKHILEDLGCDVQFVDYHPGETLIPADGGTGLKRKIAKITEALRYNAPLREKIKYIKYKKNYAKNYYPYLGLSSEMNYSPELDMLVIGSDEVFNCVQNNTNVGFSPELFGQDNRAKRVITYAASFGNTTVEKLKKYQVADKISKWIGEIDAVSVRDENSLSTVKALTGEKPQHHLDPVLAYDFMGKCTDIPETVPDSNYMILYGYSGRFTKEECKIIRAYAKKKGLKIVCIGGVQDACDKFIDCNPFEVIAYFKNADCVVTDTFHGTIMSVITHRQFVSVVRKSGYGNSEKMTDLLGRLHLSDRILTDFRMLKNQIENKIDYLKTDDLIKEERKNSINYLNLEVEKCTQN